MKFFIILIIAIIPSISMADEFTSGDWIWSDSYVKDGFLFAATVTENGTYIGQYCYISEGDCYYMLNAKITCDSDSEHVTLVNSDIGSYTIKAICGHKVDDNNALYLYPFDEVDTMVKESNNIGVAIAMESGHFKVVRFSLSGSTKAISEMRAAASKLHDDAKSGETLDLEEIL
ncbi:hypothetical protein [uncultured Methylophaga sp.]|uniref:hypothetical protein n=1 Tax=uncultured Methylophaga sp. TaxID=285271 RepID=UPI0030DCBDA7